MLPPPINVIEEQLLIIDNPRQVFAILQFGNVFDWCEVVWSLPDEGGETYSHNHAEAALAKEINLFVSRWEREYGGSPNTSTITIKYSPCPECSRKELPFIVRALGGRGVTDNYLYYMDRYRGLGEMDALEGIELAIPLFAEVNEYKNRRREWDSIKHKYWWEMGYQEQPSKRRGRR